MAADGGTELGAAPGAQASRVRGTGFWNDQGGVKGVRPSGHGRACVAPVAGRLLAKGQSSRGGIQTAAGKSAGAGWCEQRGTGTGIFKRIVRIGVHAAIAGAR